ncbi:hypothetical protein BCR44DRAFT_1104035 [Catenaria anguillulae PL171]|uniref:CBS domain-containing protein n=1 Tax=Catenaria anguillulae PL171 TaxID=765915 RepID=A0A1Y2I2C9_9FUNG|nr:hypothetical protein BCR44DRAFT_1104035 [Catenaria anguillulae PL171]
MLDFFFFSALHCTDYSQMNPTLTVPLTATVAETLHNVSIERAHRVLVLDNDNELYQIVSQTQMLHYLLPALPTLLPPEFATRSLASLNWTGGPPPIRFVQSDTSVASAVHLCLQHRIHRIPVTFPADPASCSTGKPRLGVFGAWDLTRTLVVPGKSSPAPPLAPNQRSSLSSQSTARSLPPWSPGPASTPGACVGDVCERACCVDISDSLAKVVELLATRAREVIIADDMGHPVHIITQGDCLRFLVTVIQAHDGGARASRKASVDYD